MAISTSVSVIDDCRAATDGREADDVGYVCRTPHRPDAAKPEAVEVTTERRWSQLDVGEVGITGSRIGVVDASPPIC